MTWYLAPTMMDGGGYAQVANAGGQQVMVAGMRVHIGRGAPTECLVGIPASEPAVAGWSPLATAAEVTAEFDRLFGRAPAAIEAAAWGG